MPKGQVSCAKRLGALYLLPENFVLFVPVFYLKALAFLIKLTLLLAFPQKLNKPFSMNLDQL